MINNFNNYTHQTSFGSIKPAIKLGESAIKEIRKEFPYLKSDSKIHAIILDKKDNPKYRNIVYQLLDLADNVTDDIWMMRRDSIIESNNPNKIIKQTKYAMKKYGVANCGEEADIVQSILIRKGEQAHRMTLDVRNQATKAHTKSLHDHVFVVMGVKEGADLTNPKTWGSKAVIVDSWAKMADSAYNVIENYKKMFKVNPKKDEIIFECTDMMPIEEYRKTMPTIKRQKKSS